ncbi:MAG: TIGR02391 family protein [Hyphomicrobium sp.]
MLERSLDRTGGMVNRHQPAAELINHAGMHGNLPFHEMQRIRETLERNFRRAFDALERADLIEPALGMNGQQGAMVLTGEGKTAAENPLDFDVVRVRARLVPDMLHPKLRGKPYEDFANGHPTSAIHEAYKIVEIEVVAKSKLTGHGVNLMQQAFDHEKGPLTDKAENEPTRKALARLFTGAFGRFRNSSTHTQRAFPDLHEAIEELMVASRLLRFLDEPGRA